MTCLVEELLNLIIYVVYIILRIPLHTFLHLLHVDSSIYLDMPLPF